jgi:pantoate--beta-alanine ligase
MKTVRAPASLGAAAAAWRRRGASIGFVPTMGALHAGHLALVAAARATCDRVVASVFVNPRQFGRGEDYGRYPRDESGDRALLAAAGCDLLFAPAVEAIYPPGFATAVAVGGPARRWEGEARPGHFDGVATVVVRLLNLVRPDRAFFGEKDYQQLQVVRRVVADLGLAVRVVGCPTMRDHDGLALSSRNRFLTPAQRRAAPALWRALMAVAAAAARGDDHGAAARRARRELGAAGFDAVDYLAVVDAETLEPAPARERPARVLAAARLGGVRLIDNVAVPRRRRA